VRGTRGTLKEYNDAHGGPMAYLGSTVPGFPNFFMIQGMSHSTYIGQRFSLYAVTSRSAPTQVRTQPPATRPSSSQKSPRSHTSSNYLSPCAQGCSKAWRPRTARRTGTTTCCRSGSKTRPGRCARRGTASAGAAASSARSRVRSCCSGGGYGRCAGRTTRSRVPARSSGGAAT
jgi:hypothetical protein